MGGMTDANPIYGPTIDDCTVVVARETEKRVVSRSSEPRIVARAGQSGVSARPRIERTIAQTSDPAVAARLQTQTVVATTACPATVSPAPDPGPGGDVFDTVSKVNGHVAPMHAGQPVVSVNGQWLPAAAGGGRHDAVGLLLDDVLLVGIAGRARTMGLLTLTAAQWDLVQTYTGGLVPDADYYLHPSGRMTPDSDDLGSVVVVRLGTAVSRTEFVIDIEPPIFF